MMCVTYHIGEWVDRVCETVSFWYQLLLQRLWQIVMIKCDGKSGSKFPCFGTSTRSCLLVLLHVMWQWLQLPIRQCYNVNKAILCYTPCLLTRSVLLLHDNCHWVAESVYGFTAHKAVCTVLGDLMDYCELWMSQRLYCAQTMCARVAGGPQLSTSEQESCLIWDYWVPNYRLLIINVFFPPQCFVSLCSVCSVLYDRGEYTELRLLTQLYESAISSCTELYKWWVQCSVR